MALPPKLRHYIQPASAFSVSGAQVVLVPEVGPDRAVVGKVVIAANSTTGLLHILSGPTASPVALAHSVQLVAGEQFVEANIVLLAGEILSVAVANTGSVAAHFFGQEVDN